MPGQYRLHRQVDGRRDKSKVFGQLSQRSAGPLWGGLRQLFMEQGFKKKATFTAPVADMFEGDTYTLLNDFVTFIADEKHEKAGAFDLHRPLHVLMNICNRIFRKAAFGFFENLAQQRFSKEITGQFRVAHGQPPFINHRDVKLKALAPELMPYLLLPEQKLALPLSPMVLWWQDPRLQMYHGCCYLFDFAAKDGSKFSFKTIGRADHLSVTKDHKQLGELAQRLVAERAEDGPIEAVEVMIADGDDERAGS